MKIIELKGNSHTFTLSNGETFRIFARQTKVIKDSLISDDITRAEDMGLVMLVAETTAKTAEKSATDIKKGGAK